MRYKIIFTILGVMLFPPFITGQSFSEKRSFGETAKVSKESTLELNNKYGTIQITPWNKDSVSVKVEVEAFASNPDRLHKMLQGVDINISRSDMVIRAETEFIQNIGMLLESFKGMTKKIISYESRIEINYFVRAPEYLNLKITNKYGDVYMEDNSGSFSLNLSNGSFKAGSLDEVHELKLAFCNASIKKITDGSVNASFSDIDIGESGDLTINSISSRYDITRTGTLDIDSKRDKLFIGSAVALKGSAYFSDLRFDELEKEIDFSSEYGSLSADHISKYIELISINSGYSDISLTFDPEASYNLDIKQSNTFLVLPEKNADIEKKILNDDRKETMAYGTVGKNPGNVKVRIDANRGNVYIK